MNVIEVDSLTKRYGDRTVVDDVSFAVEESEILAILGPNGSGKTTTVESIAGMRTPDAGTIRVAGLDPLRDRVQLRRMLGIQLQESELPDRIRVREAVELFGSFYDEPADGDQLITDLGLDDQRDIAFKKLSGGQKQRLSVALALVGKPRIAILDELTTGLDPAARRDTWELIQEVRDRGVTIVLVTHAMEEAERLADRVAIIDGGRLVAFDTPAGIVAQAGGDQRLRFRPSGPFEDQLLTDLAGVRALERHGPQVVVTGSGDVVTAVVTTLASQGITTHDVRIEDGDLDAAFLAITGRRLDA
jgi:ABC-2 type transport system ATP-binding protein